MGFSEDCLCPVMNWAQPQKIALLNGTFTTCKRMRKNKIQRNTHLPSSLSWLLISCTQGSAWHSANLLTH